MKTGDMIRKYRKEKGWSQRKLSELSGVSHTQIANYETSKTEPTLETIKKIAKALDIGVFDLIEFKEIEKEVLDNFKLDLNKDEFYSTWSGDPSQIALNYRYNLLNEKGKRKALDNIGDLVKIEEYTRKD